MALRIKTFNASRDNGEDATVSSYSQVEEQLHKRAKLCSSEDSCSEVVSRSSHQPHLRHEHMSGPKSPVSIAEFLASGSSSESEQTHSSDEKSNPVLGATKSGRWSLDEKLLFLYGLSIEGKGRWKRIHKYVPER